METEQDAARSPKVFISYSWSSEDHVTWVRELGEKLIADGVDVILDQWDLKPGQDKYKFMEQMVSDPSVTKVLLICDRRYAEKADGRKGGVGDETQIVSSEVYGSVTQTKFLPIVAEVDENGQPYKPAYIKARIHINLSNPESYYEQYDSLLREIYGAPLVAKPAPGKTPAFLLASSQPLLKTTHKLQAFRNAVYGSKASAIGSPKAIWTSWKRIWQGMIFGSSPQISPTTTLVRTSGGASTPRSHTGTSLLSLWAWPPSLGPIPACSGRSTASSPGQRSSFNLTTPAWSLTVCSSQKCSSTRSQRSSAGACWKRRRISSPARTRAHRSRSNLRAAEHTILRCSAPACRRWIGVR